MQWMYDTAVRVLVILVLVLLNELRRNPACGLVCGKRESRDRERNGERVSVRGNALGARRPLPLVMELVSVHEPCCHTRTGSSHNVRYDMILGCTRREESYTLLYGQQFHEQTCRTWNVLYTTRSSIIRVEYIRNTAVVIHIIRHDVK